MGCARSSTSDDLADELGISVSAAKVRLHRARRHLREQVFPLPGENPTGETIHAR